MDNKFERKIYNVYKVMFEQCLGLKSQEEVVLLFDEDNLELSKIIENASHKHNQLIKMIDCSQWLKSTKRISNLLHEKLVDGDVVIDITSPSIYDSKLRLELCEKGVRYICLSKVDLDIFMRTFNTDYQAMQTLSERINSLMKEGSRIEITSKLGTKILVDIEGKNCVLNVGDFKNRGNFGTLPAGEVYIEPNKGGTEGVIVFDKMVDQIGLLNRPITAYVSNGEVKHLEGGEEAYQLTKIINNEALNLPLKVLEFGIGLNKDASIIGKIIEASKSFGHIKILFGIPIGVNETLVAKYYGGIVSGATVKIDDFLIIEHGKMVL